MNPPLPPQDVASRSPDLITVKAGERVHRFHNAAYEPIHFDRSRTGRLNAPDGSYGVLYVAHEAGGAFAETFMRRPGRTLIDADLVRSRAYARLHITADLTLIRLAGPGLARLGATAEVVHGGLPYDAAQAWSKALQAHPVNAHGVAYRARHDDDALCYAIFDRASSCVRREAGIADLDQAWFWQLANHYRVGRAPGP